MPPAVLFCYNKIEVNIQDGRATRWANEHLTCHSRNWEAYIKLSLKTKALDWGHMLQEEYHLQYPEWAPAQVVDLLIGPTTRWVGNTERTGDRMPFCSLMKLTYVWANLLVSQPRGLPTWWGDSNHESLWGDHQWQELVWDGLVEVLERRLDLKYKGTVSGSPCPALLGTHACAHGQPAPGHVPYKWKWQPISVCLQSTYSQGENSGQD